MPRQALQEKLPFFFGINHNRIGEKEAEKCWKRVMPFIQAGTRCFIEETPHGLRFERGFMEAFVKPYYDPWFKIIHELDKLKVPIVPLDKESPSPISFETVPKIKNKKMRQKLGDYLQFSLRERHWAGLLERRPSCWRA